MGSVTDIGDQEYDEERLPDYEYELLKFEESYDGRLAILQAALSNEEISYAEYTERIKQLDRDIAVNKLDATASMFGEIANLMGSFAKGQKAAILFQLFADQASALSSLMKMSEANPSNAVTGGLAGMLQYASGIIRIGINFAKSFGALKQAKENDVAKASKPQVKQYASGRYDVVGEQDNRLYRNVPYRGIARTGMVHGPALVSERGDEFIVDATSLRNPIVANYARAIAKTVRVPQHAAGVYDTVSNVTDNQLLLATVAKLAEAVDKFPRTVKAQMSYFDDFKPVQDEVENTNNTITL